MPRVGVGSSHQLWGLGNAMKCHWKIFCILMSPDHMSYKLILSTTGTRMGVGRNHPIIPKDELRVMSWRSRWHLGMGLTPSNSNPNCVTDHMNIHDTHLCLTPHTQRLASLLHCHVAADCLDILSAGATCCHQGATGGTFTRPFLSAEAWVRLFTHVRGYLTTRIHIWIHRFVKLFSDSVKKMHSISESEVRFMFGKTSRMTSQLFI